MIQARKEAAWSRRQVFCSIGVVVTGTLVGLGWLWARVSLDLVGSDPQEALGHLALWGGTLAFIAGCTWIGSRLRASDGILSVWVGCIGVLAALWIVSILVPQSSIVIHGEALTVALPFILAGGSAAAAGKQLRGGGYSGAVVLMSLGGLIVWPMGWVILFFE